MPQRQAKAGDLKRLSISIPPPLYDDILAEAEDRDVSVSSVAVERLERERDSRPRTGAPARVDAVRAPRRAKDLPVSRASLGQASGPEPIPIPARVPDPTVKDAVDSLKGRPEPSGPVTLADTIPDKPIRPRDPHKGHTVENRGYMMFCVDCKERVR